MKTQHTPAFGRWLQKQLDRREWNQAEFAAKAGVSSGRVSDWIREVRAPNLTSCEKIAETLGVSLDEVLIQAGHHHDPLDNPEQAALISLLRRVDLARNHNGDLLRSMLEAMIGYSTPSSPRSQR
jgi:transcriptional regulator with XRE-family HTH domain